VQKRHDFRKEAWIQGFVAPELCFHKIYRAMSRVIIGHQHTIYPKAMPFEFNRGERIGRIYWHFAPKQREYYTWHDLKKFIYRRISFHAVSSSLCGAYRENDVRGTRAANLQKMRIQAKRKIL
jgi:hypothetical protein